MTADFEPGEMLEVLAAHGVRFVVVGGFAATYHGSPHLTFDLDITPELPKQNLDRLSDSAQSLREDPQRHRAGWCRVRPRRRLSGKGTVWNLLTDHGDLDLTIEPSGTRGYTDLIERRR